MLLQVVTDPGDVGRDLDPAVQPDACHLAQRRVRLLGGGRVDAGAHATTLRAPLECRGLGLLDLVLPALADQLLDRGQRRSRSFVPRRTRRQPSRMAGLSACCVAVPLLAWMARSVSAGVSVPDPRGRACRALCKYRKSDTSQKERAYPPDSAGPNPTVTDGGLST
ncbi:conserved hypothetical protein [Parafrankia sp. Ea1.12]|nr:conserved hypothetical protein [Parafrankia sp. Ea1.12]